MSDLKDLAWTVQSTAAAPDFDTIVRRANRRRTRRQAITAATTTTAVVAAAVLSTTGPLRDRSGDPAATIPTPTRTSELPPLRSARDVVYATDAHLEVVRTSPGGGWAASWSSCATSKSAGPYCQYAAVTRDASGRVAIGPVTAAAFAIGRDDRTTVALDLEGKDSSTGRSRAVLVTQSGRSVVTLTRRPATPTVGPYDVLIGDEPGPLVIDPERRTVRRLVLPADVRGGRLGGVVRDRAGTIWLLAASTPTQVILLRSHDGGRTWTRSVSPGDVWASTIAVSPDGETVLASTAANPTSPSTIRVSHDAGRNWSTLPQRLTNPGLAAFDDGTGIVYAGSVMHKLGQDLTLTPMPGAPSTLESVSGTGDTVYGKLRNSNTIAVSTDRGDTWRTFEPR